MRFLAIALLVAFTLAAISFAEDKTTTSAPAAPADSKEQPPPSTAPRVNLCSPTNLPPCMDNAPHPTYSPEPKYSKQARQKKLEGHVVLWMVVGVDGRTNDIQVTRSLGEGLDEQAIKAVQKWKFTPATMDGHPVAVQIKVEVEFRLY